MTARSAWLSPEPVRGTQRPRDDQVWVARLRSEDVGALEQWLRSRSGRLSALADRYLRDEVASEEVARYVMLRALRALADGDADAASWACLRQRALDVALVRLRSRSEDPEGIRPLLPRFRADGTHAEERSPWRAVDRDAGVLRREVRGCVDRLPEPHRVVLMLSDGDRLEARSIARHLAMSEERVKRILHEARLALRTLLDPLMRCQTPPGAEAGVREEATR